MRQIKGDLLEGDWDIAFHCANPNSVMGAGVALALKNKWPIVAEADKKDLRNPKKRLGHYSAARLDDGRVVVNLYGQKGVGSDGRPLNRNCQYDHLYNAMFRACWKIKTDKKVFIGVPYKMASDRAGGSWIIVEAMLQDLETRFNIEFIIYKLK